MRITDKILTFWYKLCGILREENINNQRSQMVINYGELSAHFTFDFIIDNTK